MLEAEDTWAVPPQPLRLSSEEVHVWLASLDEEGQCCRSVLDDEERARADRFRFARDRQRFTVARARLRMLLGAYSGLPPTALRFQYGPQGKPFLEGSDVQFNLSHSGNLALFAFARGRALGVDLEATDRAVEGDALAARFFSPAENAALAALPPEVRQAAFFACWTRKEAYIKATGLGLSLALDSFDVSVEPGRSARLLATRPRAEEATRWQLIDLSVAPGYVGALCVAGSGWTLHTWRWV